ncbi:MAG: NAD(P)H-dependent oxidoreductase subunit E [Treponema sp.]|jgi:NADH-quinone oxidoreductase subunit E|nr:NAD(P)H-dependent oxidoreductase subunit E [Treponema sp.]
MQELSKEQVLKIMEHYGNDPQQVIAILLDIQVSSGRNYLDKKWAVLASEVLNIPLSKIYDIITFYEMFSLQPRGEYVIEICKSPPCYYTYTKEVVKWFEEAAGIKMGETTADGKISLVFTNCVGACDIGPAVKIGDAVFGELTVNRVHTLIHRCLSDNIKPLVHEEL